MSASQHSRHGSVFAGRIIVAVACLLVLWVNVAIYRQAAAPPHPLPGLQVVAVMSLVWLYAGATAVCWRQNWGRPLMLTVLYAGWLAAFVWGIVILGTADRTLAGGLMPTCIATVVYVIASLTLTYSKHVRRLTSRIYE